MAGHVAVTDLSGHVVVTSVTPSGADRHPLEAVDAAPQVVELVVMALELRRLLAACERGDRRFADVLRYADLVALADLGQLLPGLCAEADGGDVHCHRRSPGLGVGGARRQAG